MSDTTDRSPDMPSAICVTPATWTAPIAPEVLFARRAPLEVDLGCGKGRFLLAHAARCPEVNVLGIDRLLVRLRKVERRVVRARLTNVRLLRVEASYAVTNLLPPDSVSTIYIFFPDPWPKRRHHRRRLIQPAFLDRLRVVLRHDGCVHIATDDMDYFTHIQRCFDASPAYVTAAVFEPTEDERTDFERTFRGLGRRASLRLPAGVSRLAATSTTGRSASRRAALQTPPFRLPARATVPRPCPPRRHP
jgi:tRNA (guanine-N(7)-)-methyltransferase